MNGTAWFPDDVADATVHVAPGVGERAHGFGNGLVGVLAQPRGRPMQRTALILLNAGLVYHIGPFRGYVQLARTLAALGYPVLRFDQSGLGESRSSEFEAAECRPAVVASAISLLAAETGIDRVVLGGICSGADDAFHLAAIEPRVAGLLLIDGLAYRTPGFWWRHLLRRLRHPGSLVRLLKRHLEAQPRVGDYREHPPRAEAERQLQGLVDRGVRALFLFTGGSYRYFNHRGQLLACFGGVARSSNIQLELWPDCDHTFYLRRDRQRLHGAIAEWMQLQFGEQDLGSAARGPAKANIDPPAPSRT